MQITAIFRHARPIGRLAIEGIQPGR